MLLTLALSIAHANPELPFPRHDERLRARRYLEVVEEGPARPRYRRRSGPIQAWTFPDGQLEHYERVENGRMIERRRYDAAGLPLSTVAFGAAGDPVSVAVTGTQVDVSGWAVRTVAGATVLAPGVAAETEGTLTWSGEKWRFSALAFAEAADTFAPAFQQTLGDFCGCLLLDRTTVWLDGRQGVRYRASIPDPDTPKIAELWALQLDGHTLLLASVADEPAGLATGRAIAALLDWE